MLEWILLLFGLIIAVCVFWLDAFNAFNLIQFFRGKKTAEEYFLEPQQCNSGKKSKTTSPD